MRLLMGCRIRNESRSMFRSVPLENSEMGAWRGKKVMRLHLTRAFKQVRRIQEPSLIQSLKPRL